MSQVEPAPPWRRGLVKAVDGAGPRVKVTLPDEDGMVSDWLPVCVPFALGAKAYFTPRMNSQVVILLDEHGEDGIVLGAIYSNADAPPVTDPKLLYVEMEDGTKIKVDPTASTVTVDTPGDIIAKAGRNIDATAGGHINGTAGADSTFKVPKLTVDAPLTICTGILRVEGMIHANAGITTSSGGSVPSSFTVAGSIKSDTDLISKDISFNAHVHTEQGDGADTSTPH